MNEVEARKYLNSLHDQIFFSPFNKYEPSLIGVIGGQFIFIFLGKQNLNREEICFSARIKSCLGEVIVAPTLADLTIISKKRGWHDNP
jgi:hypothetical protein